MTSTPSVVLSRRPTSLNSHGCPTRVTTVPTSTEPVVRVGSEDGDVDEVLLELDGALVLDDTCSGGAKGAPRT